MAGERDFRSEEDYQRDNEGFLTSDDLRTGYTSGLTFTLQPVQYSAVNGLAVFEGCIILGSVEEMERAAEQVRDGRSGGQDDSEIAHGVGITGEQYRWPNALMPYSIDSGLTNQSRVTDAVAHWESKTNMSFVQRTSANASSYPNYVHFIPSDGCWSYVGMRGGQQDIGLAGGCGLGSTIHEIGHAWGLWHEQSREDRDTFVTINWANIEAGREHNFNQHISDGDDYGPYDYGSIMHYGATAFSKNGQPTIVPTQSGVTIGQRTGLSAGDINAVHAMYKTWHYSKRVYQTFASRDSRNAWANVESLGWRRIKPDTIDGVTSTFNAFCEAAANEARVHVYSDGAQIEIMYLA
jgi:hypothetical protein